jgi:hypothetical protein
MFQQLNISVSKIETYTCFRSTFLSNQELTPFPSGRFAGPASSLYYVFFVNFRDIYNAAGLYKSDNAPNVSDIVYFFFAYLGQMHRGIPKVMFNRWKIWFLVSGYTAAPKLELQEDMSEGQRKAI